MAEAKLGTFNDEKVGATAIAVALWRAMLRRGRFSFSAQKEDAGHIGRAGVEVPGLPPHSRSGAAPTKTHPQPRPSPLPVGGHLCGRSEAELSGRDRVWVEVVAVALWRAVLRRGRLPFSAQKEDAGHIGRAGVEVPGLPPHSRSGTAPTKTDPPKKQTPATRGAAGVKVVPLTHGRRWLPPAASPPASTQPSWRVVLDRLHVGGVDRLNAGQGQLFVDRGIGLKHIAPAGVGMAAPITVVLGATGLVER